MSVARGLRVMRAEEGVDMFGKSNGSNGQLLDEQLGVAPTRETRSAATVAQPQQQPQHSSVAQPRATLQPSQTPETGETISTLGPGMTRSEEHTSELQSLRHLVCRLLLEKKK